MVHWAVEQGSLTDTVTFPSDGQMIRAFLARPAHIGGQAPAILLLHEWWGLTDHTKTVARRWAENGYVVLAPDLYSRQGSKVTNDPQEASALMNALSSQHALRDLNAAVRYLKAQPFVDPYRLGVLGFSMGGTLALSQAEHNSDLKAAVVFYGKTPPIESFRYFLCPVMYHYGAKDGWVTKQEVDRLQQGFAVHGNPSVVHVYPDANHGFCNESQRDAYRPEDARLACERTKQFFGQHLR